LIVSTTFGPMRGYRARGQLWAFVYLAVRQWLGFGILSLRAERSNEIELLALRTRWWYFGARWCVLTTGQPIVRPWLR
jgi:hypothetical protein